MVIDGPTRNWVVSYDHPVGGAMLQTLNLISGRGKAKAWKKTLAEAEGGGTPTPPRTLRANRLGRKSRPPGLAPAEAGL